MNGDANMLVGLEYATPLKRDKSRAVLLIVGMVIGLHLMLGVAMLTAFGLGNFSSREIMPEIAFVFFLLAMMFFVIVGFVLFTARREWFALGFVLGLASGALLDGCYFLLVW